MDSASERDRTVERLLRESLREAPRGGVTGACLDGETLAAWADGGLSGSALEDVQRHVADCARCQDLAGTLVRLRTPVPAAEPARAPRRWLAVFVPLVAAAAAVALWFALPRGPATPISEREVARSAEPPQASAAPEVRPQLTAPSDRQRAEPAAPAARESKQTTEGDERSRSDTTQPQASADVAAKKTASADLAKDKEKLEALALQDAASANARAGAAAAIAAAPPAPSPAAAAGALAAPSPAPPSAAPAAERFAARSAARATNAAAADIISPDPMVRWRIAGSSVQHSSNGGATWENVSIGFPAELTAGVAPAPNVCWLVGRNGAVLLTTDGRTWRRAPFPEMTDLSAIRAVDAGGRVASVVTADGRTFVTTDGGFSWAGR